jgi:hypothetical protein
VHEQVIESLKAAKEVYVEAGRKAFRPAVDEFLAAHPEVEAVRWTQYTPYFDDGDPCVFSVNDPEVRLAGGTEATPDDEDDEDDEEIGQWRSAWDLGYDSETKSKDFTAVLCADLKSLSGLFAEIEDVLLEIFDDHVRVTIGRDGEPDVEEYGHD